ncbi:MULTISPECIES: hypothetical protein [unclassified Nocardioides]|uniref:hypothetical protein n=1 Tax=unclassified Nocardioides TaxID=2615069 RepID=UPI0006F78905|nr:MULTISPECIES: hypothetical protein [unclassified Nocardioides]KRA32368.1 hypothetical protein ASD81_12370 [Nocardioides sp. Root614]KRA89020.1 hypothetical protein ASD84_12635 [Nocardioides sp. Root682]
MAHLIQSLTSTARSVITLPVQVAKTVAVPVLRRVGGHEEEPEPSRPTGRVEPAPPPVRRTAEAAVARERAAEPSAADTTDTEDPEDRYEEYDEAVELSGNAAPVDGAGSDSGGGLGGGLRDES